MSLGVCTWNETGGAVRAAVARSTRNETSFERKSPPGPLRTCARNRCPPAANVMPVVGTRPAVVGRVSRRAVVVICRMAAGSSMTTSTAAPPAGDGVIDPLVASARSARRATAAFAKRKVMSVPMVG